MLDASNNWVPRDNNTLIAGLEGDLMGSSVDISSDGSTLIAGAPGRNSGAGGALIMQWDGTAWQAVFIVSASTDESMGSSVQFLAADGSVAAIGSPGYSGGQGRISVYQRTGSGTYELMGDPIEGAAGDSLGGINSISGSSSGTPSLLASTSSGVIYAYTWNSVAWVEEIPPFTTGLVGQPAVSGSTNLQTFVGGSNNQVATFTLQ
jgi:hypothetical protein